jgi:glycosyltransferase involved in cell wall biosynthesis
MGKAIVASDVEQVGEILKAGLHVQALPADEPIEDERRLSVLCPPGDARALATALRFAVERPAWRATLGRNARAEALAKYTWEHHVSALVDGLEAIAKEPRHA